MDGYSVGVLEVVEMCKYTDVCIGARTHGGVRYRSQRHRENQGSAARSWVGCVEIESVRGTVLLRCRSGWEMVRGAPADRWAGMGFMLMDGLPCWK